MPSLATSGRYSPTLLLRIFLPFALGYFLSYLFRVVNNIISTDLVSDLAITATQLGLLTSTYFITFAAVQIPLGVLLDRFGPRKVEAILLVFAAIGSALFASAESFGALLFGRALIGVGVSACLMAAFKAFVQWFPKERLALVNGLQMTAGGLGALCATYPTKWMLQWTDWRGLFMLLAGVCLIVAFIIWFTIPDKGTDADVKPESMAHHVGGIFRIFSDRYFWRIVPLGVISQAIAMAFIGLWSGPWLRDVAGLSQDEITTTLTLIALSMTVGFLSFGLLSDQLARFRVRSETLAIGGLCFYTLILFALSFNPSTYVLPLWILFGFFSTAPILLYSILSQHFDSKLAGRANTAFNFLVFVAAFFSQWGIGAIIDSFESVKLGHYAVEGYQRAFFAMAIVQLMALLWYRFSRTR